MYTWRFPDSGSYRHISERGRRTGSRGSASDVGAVMMVRGGRFGMPAEWDAARPGADVVAALVESERERRGKGGKLPSEELEDCVEGMRGAVPRPREREGGRGRRSAFHDELDAADGFVAGLAGGSRQSIHRRRRPSTCAGCCRVPRSWRADEKSASKKLSPSTTTGLESPV